MYFGSTFFMTWPTASPDESRTASNPGSTRPVIETSSTIDQAASAKPAFPIKKRKLST